MTLPQLSRAVKRTPSYAYYTCQLGPKYAKITPPIYYSLFSHINQ